jgi:hypothetical protein
VSEQIATVTLTKQVYLMQRSNHSLMCLSIVGRSIETTLRRRGLRKL